MSVRTRLVVSTIIEFVIFALIIGGILIATDTASRSDDQVRFSLQRLAQAQSVAKNAGLELDLADELRITGGVSSHTARDFNKAVAESFALWMASLRENIKVSGKSTLGTWQAGELIRVEALKKEYESVSATLDSALRASAAGDNAAAASQAALAKEAYTNTFLPGLERAVSSEQAKAASADTESKSAANTARVVPLVLAPLGLIAVAIISFLLMRDITRSLTALKDGAVQMGKGNLDVVIDTGRADEFKEVGDAFNRMAADLKRTTDELRQYAHTVSHDLKGPLSSVLLASGLLAEQIEAPPGKELDMLRMGELSRIVRDNTGRAVDLIDELLTLAEAGQVPGSASFVDVSGTISQILDERAGGIQDRGISIEVGTDLGFVRANPAHVYQIFSNLIGNAIKYGSNEKPVLRIDYLGDDEDGAHRYQVRDNGPGVDPEDIDHVFEPFYKGEEGGTGIGLATVQKIASVYGGAASVRNEGGAVFEFTLRDWKPAT